MSDDADSPFPPSKRGTNPASLSNLRPAKKGEPSRNAEGKNGRHRSEYIAAFLEKPDSTELGRSLIVRLGLPEDTPRIDALLQRDVIAGLGKNEQARKLMIEQYGGRAKQAMDLTNAGGAFGLKVLAILPDNGHEPENHEEDQQPTAEEAPSDAAKPDPA